MTQVRFNITFLNLVSNVSMELNNRARSPQSRSCTNSICNKQQFSYIHQIHVPPTQNNNNNNNKQNLLARSNGPADGWSLVHIRHILQLPEHKGGYVGSRNLPTRSEEQSSRLHVDIAFCGVVDESYRAGNDPVGVALLDVRLLLVFVSEGVVEHCSDGPRQKFTVIRPDAI